jgi:20S proteasome alpha/beta subunit
MTLEDAEKLALTALKETMEEKISKNNVEVMVINNQTKKVQRKTPEQVAAILGQIA